VAGFFIILISLAVTLLRMGLSHDFDTNSAIEFGTATLNSLSILWLAFVIARNEKKHHAEFGEAIRREMPTVIIALFISLVYSAITVAHMLAPSASAAS